MRVVVPSETDEGFGSLRSGHFGHTPWFTIVTIQDGKCTQVEVAQNVDHDLVGCGGVIDYVVSLDVDAIIAMGMGVPPFTRFTQAAITVYIDGTQPYVGGAITLLLQDRLPQMQLDQACRH